MSRIAGVMGGDAASCINGMLDALSYGVAVAPASSKRIDVTPEAALAVTGHVTPLAELCADDLALVIDGDIYNRKELGAFTTDAELVADLYRRYGFKQMLPRLNGDFAIALYDRRTNELWLARDRLGVKPLYYAQSGGLVAFASRPRPLLDLPGVGSGVNRRFVAVFAASHYRYFDNVPHESPYERVAQLPAASWLLVRDGRLSVGRYWQLEDFPEWTAPQHELAEHYRELMLSAVEIRVRSSTRAAFTLSGGMDSSSVLACAARRGAASPEAFSTVYSDKTFDESTEIQPMLKAAVSKWHQVVVDDPDVFRLVSRMVDVNDEPVATATWLAHFVLCEHAANAGFGALFGGLGGDELNAGEYEYFFFHFADLARAKRTADLTREIEHWAAHHDHPIYRKDSRVAMQMIERCTDWSQPGRCLPDLARMRRYYSALNSAYFDISRFDPVMEHPFGSYMKTRMYQDLTRETAPCCLRAEDRQTQAFGLHNHVPFFDHRLVEFMFRVPGEMKIRDGVTKVLLRDAMKGILPEETRTRVKKTGWNAPAHVWFAGKARNTLRDLVHSRAFRERGLYRVEEVLRIMDEHESVVETGAPRENHMMFLWQLVNLETWLQSLE